MPALHRTSRPPLERMLRIHETLQKGRLVNCTKLCEQLEVSRKTVVRDITFMRDRLDLPIEFDSRINSYRYTHPVDSFPTVQVTEGELLALLVARQALEQYQGTPFHQQLSVAFEKLAGGLRDKIAFSPAAEMGAVSFKNVGLGHTDAAVFTALGLAVKNRQEVTFQYRKIGAKEVARRRVQPYHMANRENLWYLVGRDLDREELRTFALPRISAVATQKTVFALPEDFSPEKFFAGALGVMAGTGHHEVRVRFSVAVADRLRERSWHESQELVDLPGGEVELHLVLGALEEVGRWVLGWGAAAEVLAPAELRSRVAAEVAALQRKYEGLPPG